MPLSLPWVFCWLALPADDGFAWPRCCVLVLRASPEHCDAEKMHRVEHGEEGSEINAGEGADEYANRITKRHYVLAPPKAVSGSSAVVAPSGGHGGRVLPREANVFGSYALEDDASGFAHEDGEFSLYDESHGHYDVDMEEVEEVPTPTMRSRTNGVVEFSADTEGGVGVSMGTVDRYMSHESESSDGWVDQYTNCSLSREDFPKTELSVSSATPLRPASWRTSGLSPAV